MVSGGRCYLIAVQLGEVQKIQFIADHCSAVQCIVVQCSASSVLLSAVQCSTVQFNTVHCSTQPCTRPKGLLILCWIKGKLDFTALIT